MNLANYPSHDDHIFCIDLSVDLAMRTDNEIVILEFYLPLHLSVNGKILVPSEIAFNRNGLANVNDFLFRWGGFWFQPCFHSLSFLKFTDVRRWFFASFRFLAFPHNSPCNAKPIGTLPVNDEMQLIFSPHNYGSLVSKVC